MMPPEWLEEPVPFLRQVLNDLLAGDIDREEAVQRLIDAGFTRQAAEEHVYR